MPYSKGNISATAFHHLMASDETLRGKRKTLGIHLRFKPNNPSVSAWAENACLSDSCALPIS
jgi:hypothetical protein